MWFAKDASNPKIFNDEVLWDEFVGFLLLFQLYPEAPFICLRKSGISTAIQCARWYNKAKQLCAT